MLNISHYFFFFKQKTAYEMRIRDWSSDVCSSDLYTESGSKARARPPRTKLLGFIPWKRQSSAYGYAQALDGTWLEYQRSTGRWSARRSDFGDAIHFVRSEERRVGKEGGSRCRSQG